MEIRSDFSISFEFFPPKTEEGKKNLITSAKALTGFSPDFFSVTFGAGGSTREGTLETVKELAQQTGVKVAPHLACLGVQREAILEVLKQYQSLDLSRLVALRGDLPPSLESTEFHYASDLIGFIREATGRYFHIEVAAYPEVHPQAQSAKTDILNLKKKVEAGADSAITQFFFNPDAYFYYVDACHKEGIHLPIVPGIMPIFNYEKLNMFAKNCGAEIPRWIQKRMESYGEDKIAIKQFGIELICDLCWRLIRGGVPGLHFYTLNQSELASHILTELNLDQKSMKKREEGFQLALS